MNFEYGNIWDFYGSQNNWIGVTTNGFVKNNGRCVMGRGIAQQARDKFKDLDLHVGKLILEYGNKVFLIEHLNLFTFPVKHKWMEKADPVLIERSCQQLKEALDNYRGLPIQDVFIVPPGCGNGGLTWEEVEPIMEKYFGDDNRITVVDFVSYQGPSVYDIASMDCW
jgi:hypothetical protein